MTISDDAAKAAERAKIATGLRIDATTSELATAWSRAWNEIAKEWDLAIEDLVAATRDGQWPTRAQINRSRRAQSALQAASESLTGLARQTQIQITGDLPGLIEQAQLQQLALVGIQLPPDSGIDWARLDRRALSSIVERTTQQVTALTWPLAGDATAAMKSALVRGVAVGDNPRDVARDMVSRVHGAFDGGLRRAENIARTEMIDAHRTASKMTQDANLHVIKGWRWTANLSDRTCPACLSMHGQEFPPEEPGPLGHQSCRCSRAPVTKSWRELGFDIDEPPRNAPTGPQWLAGQPESVQRKVLGTRRYDAWKAGQYPPEQWAVRRSTTGWRDSFRTSKAPMVAAGAPEAVALTDWAKLTTPEAIEAQLSQVMSGVGRVSGLAGRKGLDIEKVRNMATTVERLVADYPQVKFDFVVDRINRTNVVAQASCNYDRNTRTYVHLKMQVNSSKLSSRSKIGATADGPERDTFFWTLRPEVPDVQSFDYVLNHEFGHLLDYTTGNYKTYNTARGITTEKNLIDVAREQGISQPERYFITYNAEPKALANYYRWKELREREISGYGRSSPAEGIAEAFADVRVNGNYASETNRRTVDQLLELLKGVS